MVVTSEQLPSPAISRVRTQIADAADRDAIRRGEVALHSPNPRGVERMDLLALFRRQGHYFLMSLLPHVVHVVRLRAEEQMLRIANAVPNVASVKNALIGRDRTRVNLPGRPVRESDAGFTSRDVNDSISRAVAVSRPEPASRGFGDILPEALLPWLAGQSAAARLNVPALHRLA